MSTKRYDFPILVSGSHNARRDFVTEAYALLAAKDKCITALRAGLAKAQEDKERLRVLLWHRHAKPFLPLTVEEMEHIDAARDGRGGGKP